MRGVYWTHQLPPYSKVVEPLGDNLWNMKSHPFFFWRLWHLGFHPYRIYCVVAAWCVSWPRVALWLADVGAFFEETLWFPAVSRFSR